MLNNSPSIINDEAATINIFGNDLPIAQQKSRILYAVQQNQIVIIYGETGSGKTTQIPQYLYNKNFNNNLIIGITQPRRIAAINMATRVAEEMHCHLGMEVGYEVRFDSKAGNSTKIKYMTDGTLLNHCLSDQNLSEYGIIMLDEAHERSVHSDILLGLLKILCDKRKDLKILITSATMRTEIFSKYFNNAPIVSFEGRQFPVDVFYEPSYSYVQSSVEIVKRIHFGKEEGDILVFLIGHDEIETCCDGLIGIPNLIVMRLIGYMDNDSQAKVFTKVKSGQRKVVVATNIAETTITIEGIKYVIDCGFVKQNNFDPNLGMDILKKTLISKAQANQRKGRAGRTTNGECYRLYNNSTYKGMLEEAISEIRRKNLSEVYLKIVSFGLDPMTFKYIDPPEIESLQKSEKELQDLDLLDSSKRLTEIGNNMYYLPVEPTLGKVLLFSSDYSCTEDVIIIMLMMTENSVFLRSKGLNREVNLRHENFHDSNGDHFTQLNIFNAFQKNGKSKSWCQINYLNYDILKQVEQAKEQLILIMRRKNLLFESPYYHFSKDSITRAIIYGYYKNICRKVSKGVYVRYYTNEQLHIHRGSCLFKKSRPNLILYHKVVQSDTDPQVQPYMHGILKLESSMLMDFVSEMKKINYTPPSYSASGYR